MNRLILFLTIALAVAAEARAGGAIDTLWTKPYDYMVGSFNTIAINHDSTIVAVGSEKGYVKLYNINTGDSIACFNKKDCQSYSLSFSPDGEHFAYGFLGHEMTIVNLQDMSIDTVITTAKRLVYNPIDSNVLILDEQERKIKVLSKTNYTELKTIEFNDTIIRMFVSQDFSKIGIVEIHNTSPTEFFYKLGVYDANKLELIKRFRIGNYHDMQFSADGKEIAVAGENKIDFYNIDSGKVARSFISDGSEIRNILFFKDGKNFVAGFWNPNGIAFVDNTTLITKHIFNTKIPYFDLPDNPYCLCFGKNESTLIEGGTVLSLIDISNFTDTDDQCSKILFIHPNPTSGVLTIPLENSDNSIDLRILNNSGEICKSKYYFESTQIQIDVSSLSSGVYFIYLTKNGLHSQTFKFVKE